MNRLAKCTVLGLAFVPAMAFAQGAQTIYKFVDENGRVTYANSPIKGGTKLELEPLTVIPAKSGAEIVQTPTARAIPVAKVISVPSSPAYAISASPGAFTATPVAVNLSPVIAVVPAPASTPVTIAALDTSDKAQQRRMDVRQRILQSEIQAEEKSLGEARVALGDEQKRSREVRMMRASFALTAVTVTPQKPLISPEVRAEIERHFERVRNLQDQVAMHEGNIAALREEMIARK